MARKTKSEPQGKIRTREHVIADMAVLHVQTLAVRCGFTAQRVESDYGYDLNLHTYDSTGAAENDPLQLQVKANENLQRLAMARERAFSFTVSKRDFRLWSTASFPVFFILFDALIQEAYWLDIHHYATQVNETKDRYVRLRVPRNHVLGVTTIRYMRERKLEVVKQLQRARRENLHG